MLSNSDMKTFIRESSRKIRCWKKFLMQLLLVAALLKISNAAFLQLKNYDNLEKLNSISSYFVAPRAPDATKQFSSENKLVKRNKRSLNYNSIYCFNFVKRRSYSVFQCGPNPENTRRNDSRDSTKFKHHHFIRNVSEQWNVPLGTNEMRLWFQNLYGIEKDSFIVYNLLKSLQLQNNKITYLSSKSFRGKFVTNLRRISL